jgi:hypothetical protein
VARVKNVEDPIGKDNLLALLAQSSNPDKSLVVGQHWHGNDPFISHRT